MTFDNKYWVKEGSELLLNEYGTELINNQLLQLNVRCIECSTNLVVERSKIVCPTNKSHDKISFIINNNNYQRPKIKGLSKGG